MSIYNRYSRFLAVILCVTIVVKLAGCGTLMYPERKGQSDGKIDVGVAILDGLGLLLFIIPGLIAYGVDFHTGAIYLPPEGASLDDGEEHATAEEGINVVYLDPDNMTAEAIENAIAQATGITIDLDDKSIQAYRHAARSELVREVAKLNIEFQTSTVALAH